MSGRRPSGPWEDAHCSSTCPASKESLLRRLAARNQRRDANALTVAPEALDDFFARFEPPTADEDAVSYNGDVEVIRSMVR
ncbi:hypothetical protein SAFG77S_08536 [Streptomyces afghaniensis]